MLGLSLLVQFSVKTSDDFDSKLRAFFLCEVMRFGFALKGKSLNSNQFASGKCY